MTLNEYIFGPKGAAFPLNREQRLEMALLAIRDETSWVSKRRLKAHQAAMRRIFGIANEALAPAVSGSTQTTGEPK